MPEEHDHDFATVVAFATAPGAEPASWGACRECGAEDPDNPKPEGAIGNAEELEALLAEQEGEE